MYQNPQARPYVEKITQLRQLRFIAPLDGRGVFANTGRKSNKPVNMQHTLGGAATHLRSLDRVDFLVERVGCLSYRDHTLSALR